MPGEWCIGTLEDFVALQRGHDLTDSERRLGSVPVMGSAGQNGFHDTALVTGPGVVIGRSGASFGKVHYCPQDYWPHNTALYVTDFKGNDPRFAYYFLSAIDFSRYNSGSAQPSLNRNYIYSIQITFPGLLEQQAIACILGALDDKIELNRRMNRTLETIAQAIFKSWFVDFNPVRAKAEGRDPGLPQDIAALFPDAFEDSGPGEIPRGWNVGKLSDLVTNIVDRVQPSPLTEAIPYVPIECISPRTICLSDSQPGSNARSSLVRFQQGDIMFGAMRPYFHKVCITPFDGTTRTTAFVLRPDPLELAYSALMVRRDETIDFATAHSEGSTIPYAKWSNSLESLEIVLPPRGLRREFHLSIQPTISRMMRSVIESQTLTAIRDALLPKLIFGELRVTDAERIVGRCV